MKARFWMWKAVLAAFCLCIVMMSRVAIASSLGLPDETEKDKVVRIAQARELLGKYYRKSAVSRGEKISTIRAFIGSWTRRSVKGRWRKDAQRVANTILSESRRHHLDPAFLLAVISNESGFRPDAVGGVGEIGLMQLRPKTAKQIANRYGLPWHGKKTLFDPVMNIRIGAAYLDILRSLFEKHGRLYLAAYNMGPKNTMRAVKKGVWPKDYPARVMRQYVAFYSALHGDPTPAQTDYGSLNILFHLAAWKEPQPVAINSDSNQAQDEARQETETFDEKLFADHELEMIESGQYGDTVR